MNFPDFTKHFTGLSPASTLVNVGFRDELSTNGAHARHRLLCC
jgi:hypothetical protein